MHDQAVKKVLGSSDGLNEEQRELLSTAYSYALRAIRRPDLTAELVQDVFINIADALGVEDPVAVYATLEGSKVSSTKAIKELLLESEIDESVINLFIEFLNSAKKQVIPDIRYTFLD